MMMNFILDDSSRTIPKRVAEAGVLRDVSGTNFSGVAAQDFTVRTALTGSSPLGWRLVASNISATGLDGEPGGS